MVWLDRNCLLLSGIGTSVAISEPGLDSLHGEKVNPGGAQTKYKQASYRFASIFEWCNVDLAIFSALAYALTESLKLEKPTVDKS
jgi:hypothetical protein